MKTDDDIIRSLLAINIMVVVSVAFVWFVNVNINNAFPFIGDLTNSCYLNDPPTYSALNINSFNNDQIEVKIIALYDCFSKTVFYITVAYNWDWHDIPRY